MEGVNEFTYRFNHPKERYSFFKMEEVSYSSFCQAGCGSCAWAWDDFGGNVTMWELGGMKTQIEFRQMIQSLKGTGINPSTSGWYCGLKSYPGHLISWNCIQLGLSGNHVLMGKEMVNSSQLIGESSVQGWVVVICLAICWCLRDTFVGFYIGNFEELDHLEGS